MDDEIIISDSLDQVGAMQCSGYITHAYCSCGSCRFVMDGQPFGFEAGNCLIVPHSEASFSTTWTSPDFVVEVIYVKAYFTLAATPQSNYGTRGHLALFENPVMHLDPEQQQVCALNFDYLRRRLALERHHFHRDAMINAVQCMIIDFFDFHAEASGGAGHALPPVSSPQARLMQQFMDMLERGDFRQHRDIGHYAAELCVTAKHLSEVCKKVSGQSAMHWITLYTARDIARQLRTTDLTIEQLADRYHFASTNYFVRYVHKNLGATPASFRE